MGAGVGGRERAGVDWGGTVFLAGRQLDAAQCGHGSRGAAWCCGRPWPPWGLQCSQVADALPLQRTPGPEPQQAP